jgi:predicted phage terminase large subunit-like protein
VLLCAAGLGAVEAGELIAALSERSWNMTKLIDIRRRLDFPSLKREVVRLREEFRPNKILVEDKASGTQLIQELKEAGIFETFAYAPPAGADKIMRLHAQTAPFENGAVFLPGDAPWLADYVNELTGFPGSRYADQVDSTTQALDYLRTTYRNDSWINHVDWDAVERKMWEWGFTARRDPYSTF